MKKRLSRIGITLGVAAFWIGVWWLVSWRMGNPLLLPDPTTVIKLLCDMMQTAEFYLITAISLGNVLSGIVVAVILGVLLAILTSHVRILRELLLPLMTVIKATPIASFIILALIWMGSGRLPSFITVLIVLPVVWTNLDIGFSKIDPQLREVATVYGFSFGKRLRLLILPSLRPYFVSSVRTSLGLAWKAGIAAEIIAMPRGTIGTMIGEAKLYIEYDKMFAWTLTVILLSLMIELAFTALIDRFDRGLRIGEEVTV